MRYYFTLLKEERVAPVPLDRKLIARVRKVLMSVPAARRYYDQVVSSVAAEKIDAAGSDARTNLRYPAIILPDMFSTHPDVMKVLTSETFEKNGMWQRVEGPYTAPGHDAVLRNIAMGSHLLQREAWVVPLGREETPDRIAALIAELASDYERRYIDAWMGLLADVTVRSPGTLQEAIRLYRILAHPPWPYLQLLRGLEDHTQWPIARRRPDPEWEKKALALARQRLSGKIARKTGGLSLDLDVLRISDRTSVIPALFAKTVGFGVPTEQSADSRSGGLVVTSLARYISRLDALRDQMERLLDDNARTAPDILTAQLADAAREAEELVAAQTTPAPSPGFQDPAPLLLRQLRCPLQVGNVRLPAPRLVTARIQCL